jgi:hypothetical protein
MLATATLENSSLVVLIGTTGLVTRLAKLRSYFSTDKNTGSMNILTMTQLVTLNPRSNPNSSDSKDKTSTALRDYVDQRCFQED